MIKWLKLTLRRGIAAFRGWLDNEPLPQSPSLRRSIGAAATPPQEFDPCKDPFGDNMDQKALEFDAALESLQSAVEAYLQCRIDHQSNQVAMVWVQTQFASAQSSVANVVASVKG